MKIKFLKTVATAKGYHPAGKVVDIADRHAAEVYIAHGDAAAVEPGESNLTSTLGPRAAVPYGCIISPKTLDKILQPGVKPAVVSPAPKLAPPAPSK